MTLAESSPTGLQVGDILGHYQLLAVVGAGGMGRVWAARQVGALQRLVAIKTALCESGQSKEFERVFIDEARIASLIHHPHVCGVYELGEEKGSLYLVMEWSDGGTLLDVLSEQPEHRLPYHLAVSVVSKVCAGLHAAHELEDETGEALNVVHRDVTPQNILLSSRGHVRLADFGVAKAQGQLHRPTETGEVKGKLSYMAPEQLTSKNLDRRVDIFALGCVLYECATGQRPFHGDGALSTLYQILEEEVAPPSTLRADFPPGLEKIALRALEKDPARRYQTAESMQKDLETWLFESGKEVGEQDFAALVNSTLGETIKTRNALIDEAIARIDFPERFVKAKAASVRPPEKADSSTPGLTNDRDSSKGRSGWLWPVLAGLGTLSAVTVFALSRSAQQDAKIAALSNLTQNAQAAGGPSADAKSTNERPVIEKVRITVKTEPVFATVQVDDNPPVDSPYSAEVVADGKIHRVVVAAQGFTLKQQDVLFDSARDVFVRLTPLTPSEGSAAAASSGKNSGAGVKPKKPNAGGVTGATPATTAAASEGTTKKNIRILDTTNPFGE